METINLLLKNPIIIIALIIMITFKVFPPKRANSIYGYRTSRSIKNKSNWDFAQRYSANLSLKLLIPLFLIQISLYIVYESTVFIDLSILICWILSFGIVLFKTEQKLKEMK